MIEKHLILDGLSYGRARLCGLPLPTFADRCRECGERCEMPYIITLSHDSETFACAACDFPVLMT